MIRPVPLIRRFTPISKSYLDQDVSMEDLWPILDRGGRKEWAELREEHRVILLADAGAGKTFELKAEAERLCAHGRPAFFIRIEDIDADFGNAFEVGTAVAFANWLAGTDEAWFFLDSVDEVRLDEPRAFENAMRAFADRIHNARQRAHVYISSRPYAWRTNRDRALIDELLPFERAVGEPTDDEPLSVTKTEEAPASALQLYRLAPLDTDDIRIFAGHRGVENVDGLIAALERSALFSMAQVPFDLEDILATWLETGSLESRLAVLERGLRRRLAPARALFGKQGLPLERALDGARRLALAATLTAEANIRMPGAAQPGGIDAAALLEGWRDEEVIELLGKGVFSDALYSTVRFRHRETRELLAAQWFAERLAHEERRPDLEALIFREQYSEKVIVPRLRPILPWLILFDTSIRDRALALEPGLASEGGDAARLPLVVRRRILADIVRGIVEDEARGGDNSEIARIAHADLADDALALIERHFDNDDAIFFLGRFVWQGEMKAAAERLVPIARDPGRGIYARIVSARAVATITGADALRGLWNQLNSAEEVLPRRLLAELVDAAPPDEASIELLLASIGKLEPYERFEVTGLGRAIHGLINRLPLTNDHVPSQPLPALVAGLSEYLGREPFIERRECRISNEYRWLMTPAMHVVERLIVGRAGASFAEPAIGILTRLPALRDWGDTEERGHRTSLRELVPRWVELNDALLWRTVADARRALERKGERLVELWPVAHMGHLWAFDAASFQRVLAWIGARPLEDDRHVALSLAFQIHVRNGRTKSWRLRLKKAVKGNAALEARLARMIRPPASPEGRKWRANERQWQRRNRRRAEAEAGHRAAFVAYVKANPEVVRVPPGLKPGQMSQNQASLLSIVEGQDHRASRRGGAGWRSLIPEFGEAVAEALRDGALRQWRLFKPSLRSEGDGGDTIPYALIFAMAGLEIEAGEDGTGLAGLDEAEAQHAMRYVGWELNGFPRWFEPLYRLHPAMGRGLIWGETRWELEQSGAEKSLHYMLHDLVYHAPWLHAEMAVPILDWLIARGAPNYDCLRYCRSILVSGKVLPGQLAELARTRLADDATPTDQRPLWFALWVDADPDTGVAALGFKLRSLDAEAGARFAEAFAVALLGGRGDSGPLIGAFRTPAHLKTLYVLMHLHIRVAEDIDRSDGKVYTPKRRDDAQDARGQLFSLLSEIPGEPTYRAIRELALCHPEPAYRAFMRSRAHERAVADSDLAEWTIADLRSLEEEPAWSPVKA